MVRVGVACSMELLQDQMNLTNDVHELKSIKNNLLGHRTVSTTQRGNRMIQLLLSFYQVDVNFYGFSFYLFSFRTFTVFTNHRATVLSNKYFISRRKQNLVLKKGRRPIDRKSIFQGSHDRGTFIQIVCGHSISLRITIVSQLPCVISNQFGIVFT